MVLAAAIARAARFSRVYCGPDGAAGSSKRTAGPRDLLRAGRRVSPMHGTRWLSGVQSPSRGTDSCRGTSRYLLLMFHLLADVKQIIRNLCLTTLFAKLPLRLLQLIE